MCATKWAFRQPASACCLAVARAGTPCSAAPLLVCTATRVTAAAARMLPPDSHAGASALPDGSSVIFANAHPASTLDAAVAAARAIAGRQQLAGLAVEHVGLNPLLRCHLSRLELSNVRWAAVAAAAAREAALHGEGIVAGGVRCSISGINRCLLHAARRSSCVTCLGARTAARWRPQGAAATARQQQRVPPLQACTAALSPAAASQTRASWARCCCACSSTYAACCSRMAGRARSTSSASSWEAAAAAAAARQ